MAQRKSIRGSRSSVLWLAIILVLVLAIALATVVFVVGPERQLAVQATATAQAHASQATATTQAHASEVQRTYDAGVAFAEAGDWEKAAEEFSRVVSLDPGYKDAAARFAEARGNVEAAKVTATAQAVAMVEQIAATATAEAIAQAEQAQATATAQAQATAEAQANAQATAVAAPTPTTASPPAVQPTATSTPHALSAQREDIARWTWVSSGQVDGPAAPSSAKAGELLLFHGDIEGIGKFRWRIFRPGEPTCRPLGTAVAVRIWGGTESGRQALAEQTIELVANQQGITDWRGLQAGGWCK